MGRPSDAPARRRLAKPWPAVAWQWLDARPHGRAATMQPSVPRKGNRSMVLEQKNRLLSLQTPLGKDALLLVAFSGREEISGLFHFELEMISDDAAIKPADIVGKNVTFGVKRADDSTRYFNGFVSRFLAGDEDLQGRRNYRAEVVPWLWFLTRTADCRVFQKQSVPKIIEKIFEDLGFSDYEISEVKESHPELEYCVQYRETDFAFVSRLMEQEGIFYFFRHQDGKHTLVLADQQGAYKDCQENEVDFPRDTRTQAVSDHITRWEHAYQFTTGKWAQTDYNFEDHPARSEKTPAKLLMTSEPTTVKLDGVDKYEVYDYPGQYGDKGDGGAYTKIRMEAEEVAHDLVEASSTCKTFTPGGKFKIGKHIAGSEKGKGFALVSVEHSASEASAYETGGGGADYANTFTCIPDSVTFRPQRTTPLPRIHGAQPAVVTGPPGEEIWPDKHGRVKVQFFWDREGKCDENSSCWVRVSQEYAGKGWGSMCIPRIGQEVIVQFLEGDPDRPIITGRVYNADQTPPYALPDAKAVSGIKSESTPGGGGYNEISVDDTKGKEKVVIHGQYDMETTVENDQIRTIGNNRTTEIGADDEEKVGANQTVDIGKKLAITAGDEIVLETGMASITMKKDGTITIKGKDITIEAIASLVMKGTVIQSKAATTNEVSAGATVKVQGGAMTTIKGGVVTIN